MVHTPGADWATWGSVTSAGETATTRTPDTQRTNNLEPISVAVVFVAQAGRVIPVSDKPSVK